MPRSRMPLTFVHVVLLLLLSLSLSACSRVSGKAGGAAAHTQGLFGRFEAIGGAQPPEPDCHSLTSPTERDSCEKEYLRQTVWPLKGFAVIRGHQGDSMVLALDSLGGYRAALPAGYYTVCVESDGIIAPDRCRDSLEVKPGVFTPYSRPFPMP